MTKIALKKLEIAEIQVLQSELVNYMTYKNASLITYKGTNVFFDAVLLIDISQKMVYNFRSKIERTSKSVANLNLEPAEAVVLLQCCCNAATMRTGFEQHVMQKFAALLHKELINLSTISNPLNILTT